MPSPADDMVLVEAGGFTMGSDLGYVEEGPAHRVEVGAFRIDRHPVTNDAFAAFVSATGHVTVAERPLRVADFPGVPRERLVPGSAVFAPPARPVDLADPGAWWHYVPGASWRHPGGTGTSIAGRGDHPVVHVAYEDALAYARWAGKALPTEAQWERAARGGLEGRRYCWGDRFLLDGRVMANVWRGRFPHENRKPHPPGTEPVGSYPPNGFGLLDMAGNVWEWTTDPFRPRHAPGGAAEGASPGCCGASRARPPARGAAARVLKGGSFLCAHNYCARFRPAARIPQDVDSAAVHVGFRCVGPAA